MRAHTVLNNDRAGRKDQRRIRCLGKVRGALRRAHPVRRLDKMPKLIPPRAHPPQGEFTWPVLRYRQVGIAQRHTPRYVGE